MTARLEIRVTPGERDSYQRAGESAGKLVADWIRDTLNRAARRQAKRD
jgi:hypothetical protein